MSEYRFIIGTIVMCNLGKDGWKLGRIISLNYREDSWPEGEVAPYQVSLVDDHSLIYVPRDDDRFCRNATQEDVKILARIDALAEIDEIDDLTNKSKPNSSRESNLCCSNIRVTQQYQSYRKGRCSCCNDCPKTWLHAELYSEHYRCAARNDVKILHHKINLEKVNVGESIEYNPDESLPIKIGFMQAPTLPRLPPGIVFSDDATLAGEVRYDPHRSSSYNVDFVAVSTVGWADDSIGLVRLEIRFKVEGNEPPEYFDVEDFERSQDETRTKARELIGNLNQTWGKWESRSLTNQDTCNSMIEDLIQLRELLESHPRLDNGKWWGYLGGYHMNVHKLLENTLFECELYLGYSLTFGDNEVRFYAEQNLKGCYQKRLLEAARFMWYDGIQLMLQSEWTAAIDIFRAAYGKKEGWGWAVNYGDIWLSEAVSIINKGAELSTNVVNQDEKNWIIKATKLIDRSYLRAKESGVFGPEGHPWISEVKSALESYKILNDRHDDTAQWLEEFNERTVYWCSQVLAGVFPFPPKERTRLASESRLIEKLPGHNK